MRNHLPPMNGVRNDDYYSDDPSDAPERPETDDWTQEEYREGRELRRCPVNRSRYRRILADGE